MGLNNLGMGIVFSATDRASNVIRGISRNFVGLDSTVGAVAKTMASKLGRSTEQITSSLKRVGIGIGIAVVGFAGLALAIGAPVSAARGLEDTMLSIAQKLGPDTSVNIEKLTDDFLQLSAALPLSALELAKVGVVAAQLGVQTAAGIKNLAFQAAQLARTSDFAEETGALALARLSKLFELPIAQANRLGSSLVFLANSTTATASGIFEITKRLAPTSKALGISVAQTNAFAATLIDAGLSSEIAGSAMSKILDLMNKKTGAFANQLKISEPAFKALFDKDATKALQLFFDSFKSIDKFKIPGALQKLGLQSGRVVRVVRAMSGQTANLSKNLIGSTKAFQDGTAMQVAFDAMTKSLTAKMDTFTGSLKNVAITIGLALIPAVGKFVDLGTTMLALLLKIPAPVRNFLTAAFVSVSAAAAITGLVIALKAAIPFLIAFLIPFAKVFLVIGLLVGAAFLLKRAWETNFGGIRDFLLPTFERISLAFQSLVALFKDGEISGALAEELLKAENVGVFNFVQAVSQAVVSVSEFFKGFFSGVEAGFADMSRAFEPVFNSLVELFRPLAEMLGFEDATDSAAENFRKAGRTIGFLFTELGRIAGEFINLTIQGFAAMSDAAGGTSTLLIGIAGKNFRQVARGIAQIAGARNDATRAILAFSAKDLTLRKAPKELEPFKASDLRIGGAEDELDLTDFLALSEALDQPSGFIGPLRQPGPAGQQEEEPRQFGLLQEGFENMIGAIRELGNRPIFMQANLDIDGAALARQQEIMGTEEAALNGRPASAIGGP